MCVCPVYEEVTVNKYVSERMGERCLVFNSSIEIISMDSRVCLFPGVQNHVLKQAEMLSPQLHPEPVYLGDTFCMCA